MNTSTKLNDKKTAVILTVLVNPALDAKSVAAHCNATEPFVVKTMKEAAERLLKWQVGSLRNKTPATIAAAAATVDAEDMDHHRGFRPRNGRMAIIRSVLEKMGPDAPIEKFFDRVTKLSDKAGLAPIKRTAVQVLFNEEVKKMRDLEAAEAEAILKAAKKPVVKAAKPQKPATTKAATKPAAKAPAKPATSKANAA